MKFDPESYTITIRKEADDGEILYVGRVAEFPNISAFTETFEAAHALVLDSIQTLKKIAEETGAEFPLPYPVLSDEFSGRVTLRISKSLHAKVSRLAAQEDISVNQYLVTAIASYTGEADGIARVVSEAANMLGRVVINAVTSVNLWKPAQYFFEGVLTPTTLQKLPSTMARPYLVTPRIGAA
ncbi:MAG: toxin-antitoxin system HicB family antitoxin [Gallionellaceae bacterium]|jgi:predicted HicB family RNase H-like nuclease